MTLQPDPQDHSQPFGRMSRTQKVTHLKSAHHMWPYPASSERTLTMLHDGCHQSQAAAQVVHQHKESE